MPLDEVGPGKTFGSYEVLEELGRGGMGRVFRARHVTLERDVALKLLAEQYARDEFYVQRFLKEARAAARLNHPGIVQIYDFGQVGEHWYLAMELVEGRSLSHFLKTWGRFSEENAIVIALQALAALAVAHAAGIVHRDVKPDNLILGKKGVLKLVDLGLAKKVDDPGASSTGFAAGTPHYISPEQIEGRADVDGRADLYSLGATLYQLATGLVPFPGPSSAVIMARHLNERPPDPRTLTPELSEGFSLEVLRLMARERDRRPASAEEASRELLALKNGGKRPSAAASPVPQADPDPASSAFETAVSTALASAEALRPPGGVPPSRPPSSQPSGPSAAPRRTPSGADALAAWDADVYRRVEEKLATRVGPLARLLVRNAARDAADFEDLCRRLAAQIPDEGARPAFLTDVLSGPASSRPSSPGARSEGRATPPPRPGSHPSGPSSPSPFPPALLAAAEQKLAAEIGPLARVLVRKESKRRETWGALVEALAEQVPDEAGRRRLREAIGPLGV